MKLTDNKSVQRLSLITIKIILRDVFQCLVDEVHAPQSLWIEEMIFSKLAGHGTRNNTKS